MLLKKKDIGAVTLLAFSGFVLIACTSYLLPISVQMPVSLTVTATILVTVQFILFRHTRHSMRASHRRTFRQFESFIQLIRCLNIDRPLPPMRNWAISPDFGTTLIELIDETCPKQIMEIGGGVSTLICAHYIKSSESTADIFSVDHDLHYAEQTEKNLRQRGLSHIAKVLHAPLRKVSIGPESWIWYDIPKLVIPPQIDLLIVDGPPGKTQEFARYPALPLLYSRLAPDAVVIVDDGGRPDEREIVSRWQNEFSDFSVEYLGLEKGAFILRRIPQSKTVDETPFEISL